MDELDGRRELVAAVAGPGRAVGLEYVFLGVHVAPGEPPLVRGLEVQPKEVLAARRAVRVLAREVDPAARGEVRRRVDVQDVEAGGVEAALRDAAQHAAVLEAAPRVRGRAGQARLVVTDVGEGVAAGVHALREVAAAFQGRGDTARALRRGVGPA